MKLKEFFVGRKKEIDFLEDLYNSPKFEMLILHGRRRVGKSYLLGHFASIHEENTVYFTADKSSEKSNVRSFCEQLNSVIHAGDFLSSFSTWQDVYSFFKNQRIDRRLVIIIDEFTYLYNSNPAYDTGLQNAIDHIFKNLNFFLAIPALT